MTFLLIKNSFLVESWSRFSIGLRYEPLGKETNRFINSIFSRLSVFSTVHSSYCTCYKWRLCSKWWRNMYGVIDQSRMELSIFNWVCYHANWCFTSKGKWSNQVKIILKIEFRVKRVYSIRNDPKKFTHWTKQWIIIKASFKFTKILDGTRPPKLMADWSLLMNNPRYSPCFSLFAKCAKRFNVFPFTDKSRYLIEKGTKMLCYNTVSVT